MHYLIKIKKSINGYAPGEVYWCDEPNAIRAAKIADIYPAAILPQYTTQKNLLIIRSGGIGDLLALSTLVGIAERTIFVTQSKYKPVFDWFKLPVVVRSFDDPIYSVKFPETVIKSGYGVMVGEDIIEQGSSKNWYDVFYSAIGRERVYGRPQLKDIGTGEGVECLIVAKASDPKRSADKYKLGEICSRHYKQVVFADEQKWSLKEYLNQLSRAQMVISVDTSAIHFREGLGKPALGLYGAFGADSRTKYYEHTQSIDIIGGCDIQPCFLHHDRRCPKGGNIAPCMTNYLQIEKAIINYK